MASAMATMESMFHLRRIHFQAYVTGAATTTATANKAATGPEKGSSGGQRGKGQGSSLDGANSDELLINDGIKPSKNPKCKSTLILLDKVTKIGRNPELVDVVLNSVMHSNMISRNHSELFGEMDAGGKRFTCYKICDHSLNGTYVNDTRVNGPVLLKEGDIIKFGHVNGAAIKPGEHAGTQQSAEFIFIFEKAVVGHHYFGYSSRGVRLHPERNRAYMQIYSDRVTPQEIFPPPAALAVVPPPQPASAAGALVPGNSATHVATTTAATAAAAAAAAMRLLPQPVTSINAVLGQALTTAASALTAPHPAVLPTVTSIPAASILGATIGLTTAGGPISNVGSGIAGQQQPPPSQASSTDPPPSTPQLTLTPDELSAHLRNMVATADPATAASCLSTWNLPSLLQLSRLQQQQQQQHPLYGTAFPAAAAAAAAAYFQSAAAVQAAQQAQQTNNSTAAGYAAAALWPAQANLAAQWRAALQQQPNPTAAAAVANDWQTQLNQVIAQQKITPQGGGGTTSGGRPSLPAIPSTLPTSSNQQLSLSAATTAAMNSTSQQALPQRSLPSHLTIANSSAALNSNNTSALSSLAAVAASASSCGGVGVMGEAGCVMTSGSALCSLPPSSSNTAAAYSSCTSTAVPMVETLPQNGAAGGGQDNVMARLAAQLQQQGLGLQQSGYQCQQPSLSASSSALMASMLQQQIDNSANSAFPMGPQAAGKANGPLSSISVMNHVQSQQPLLNYTSALMGENTPTATTINSLAAAIFDQQQQQKLGSASMITAMDTPMPATLPTAGGRGGRGRGGRGSGRGGGGTGTRRGRGATVAVGTSLSSSSSFVLSSSIEEEELRAVEAIGGAPRSTLSSSSLPFANGTANGGGRVAALAANSIGEANSASLPTKAAAGATLFSSSLPVSASTKGLGIVGSGLSILVGSGASHISGSASSHHGSAGDSVLHSPVISNPSNSRPCSYQSIPQSPPRAPCPERRKSPSDSPNGEPHSDSNHNNWINMQPNNESSKRVSAAGLKLEDTKMQDRRNTQVNGQGEEVGNDVDVVHDSGKEDSMEPKAKPLKKNRKSNEVARLLNDLTAGNCSWQHQAERSSKRTTVMVNGTSGGQNGTSGSSATTHLTSVVSRPPMAGGNGKASVAFTMDHYEKKRTLRLEERKLKELAKRKAHKMMRQISDESSDNESDAGESRGEDLRLSSDRDSSMSANLPSLPAASILTKKLRNKDKSKSGVKPSPISSKNNTRTRKEQLKKEESKLGRRSSAAAAVESSMSSSAKGKRRAPSGNTSDSDDMRTDSDSSPLSSATPSINGDIRGPPPAKRPSNGSSSKNNSLNSSGGQAAKKVAVKERRKRTAMVKKVASIRKAAGGDAESGSEGGGAMDERRKLDPEWEMCAHHGCQRPQDLSINWVQCDDCDEWYHSVCALGTNTELKDDAEFHCGCSGVATASATTIIAGGSGTRKRQ